MYHFSETSGSQHPKDACLQFSGGMMISVPRLHAHVPSMQTPSLATRGGDRKSLEHDLGLAAAL